MDPGTRAAAVENTASPASRLGSAEVAGRVGLAGGLMWMIATVIEYSRHLDPPADGSLFYFDQLLFIAALVCFAGLVLGLRGMGAAGASPARLALPVWVVGIGLTVLGTLASLLLHAFVSPSDAVYDNNPLLPVGGIISIAAALVAGVSIGRSERLDGWSRWAVLGYALYVVAALLVPLLLGAEPNEVTQVLWGVAWLAIAFALLWNVPAADR